MLKSTVVPCPLRYALTLAALLACNSAAAAVFTVGAAGSGCSHLTVQAAIDAAIATPEADTIRIARSQSYPQQEIDFTTNQDIELDGGFATCTSSTADGNQAVLNGEFGSALPVLTIRSNALVRLRNLRIINGDGFEGGGINFSGNGTLDIANTGIESNRARDGGGIYATGTGAQAKVVLRENVVIANNTARNSGGGVVAKDLEIFIDGPNTALWNNRALGEVGGGYGGGLFVLSEARSAYGYVRSNGNGAFGAISGNSAVFGGGIAVWRTNDNSALKSEVRVSANSSDSLVRINGNRASSCGGGIFLRGQNGGNAIVEAKFWRAALNDNLARDGAASCQDEDESILSFEPFSGAGSCPLGRACNEIHGNIAQIPSGVATQGATLRNLGGNALVSRTSIRFNQGGQVFNASLNALVSYFANSLMSDNISAAQLIRSSSMGTGGLFLIHVTIAGNAITAPEIIFTDRFIAFDRSLFYQPGKITMNADSGTRTSIRTLMNDPTNMPTGSFFIDNPRFVDPANGDYGLRAGSRAVDFADARQDDFIVASTDLHGRPHTLDMPIGGISNRTADVGALERPALLPLVLNGDFDADLRIWDFSAESTWDGLQNASGPAGSGSARVPVIIVPARPIDPRAPLAIGRTQCIYLPGPGRYRLNGFGRVSNGSMIDNNRVQLRWALRYVGNFDVCGGSGAPASTGVHLLATNSTWRKPLTPAEIVVDGGQFGPNTHLVVSLETLGSSFNPPTGWFDGITLEPVMAATDIIFANGFQ